MSEQLIYKQEICAEILRTKKTARAEEDYSFFFFSFSMAHSPEAYKSRCWVLRLPFPRNVVSRHFTSLGHKLTYYRGQHDFIFGCRDLQNTRKNVQKYKYKIVRRKSILLQVQLQFKKNLFKHKIQIRQDILDPPQILFPNVFGRHSVIYNCD